MAKFPSYGTLTTVAKKVFGDVKEVPRIVHEGRKAMHTGEGPQSMILWPFMAALKKLKGKKAINDIVYNKYLRRLQNADERAGRVLAQHGPSEKLFSIKETVPTKRKIKGLPAKVEHETYRASAPVMKGMKFITPLAAGMYLSEKLNPSHGEKVGALMSADPKDLMKQAADAIERHRRNNEAIKLAFAMVEKGKCKPFETLAEFEEKVASLSEKNLDAVAEALEMDTELTDFGKVASRNETAGGSSAEMNFFHRLSE